MKYKIYHGGFKPERAHFDDAGIDLRTPVDVTVLPHDSKVVDLAVAFQIPIGYFGKMESKSGLDVNHCVVTTGGVIDSGFRGTVKVRVYNEGDMPHTFNRGDRITQMVLIPCGLFDLEPVAELDQSESGREKNGWGSTGR